LNQRNNKRFSCDCIIIINNNNNKRICIAQVCRMTLEALGGQLLILLHSDIQEKHFSREQI